MTTRRRAEFAAFVLDLLDFIEEKIAEAIADERSRAAAVGEAVGAVPVLRDRLRENEVVEATFILVLGNAIEERWASRWWGDFARMVRPVRRGRPGFGRAAGILRGLVAGEGAS